MTAIGPRRLRWAVPLLLALALAVRVLFVIATPGYVPQHDDRDYDRLACWVAQHGGLPDRGPPVPGRQSCVVHGRSGAVTAYRPPLWPLALGATYAAADAAGVPRWTAGRVVQAVIGTVIVGLAGAIAVELWGGAVALVVLGLGAVFLPLVLDGATLISEPLFVALELGAVLALLRHGRDPLRVTWALPAGVCAGLAALTRSTGAVLALALIAGLWFATRRGRRLRSMAVFAAAAVLVVAPWTARNARVLGAFVPVSTEIGPTLLGTYNQAARDAPGCTGCWVLLSRTPGEEALVHRLRRLSEVQRDRESRRLATDFARRHPAYVAQVAWHNSLRLLELGGAARTRFTASTIDVPGGAAVAGAWELWLYLALAAAAVALGMLRRVPGWLVALPIVLWVTTVLVQSETPRFRAPIDPFVVLLAAAGVAAVRARIQSGGRSSTTSASIDAPPRARATDTR
jgi:4-amino-4-deoxy-L-arabinose transferase-like glycosyltransferase